jgi:ubiquinol-cytochrome c reductase cytochrome c1 subunit
MRKRANMIRFALAAALSIALGSAAAAQEEQETPHYPLEHPAYIDWTFSGPFGRFDPQQLQRGFQVYREVCRDCHALSMVAFRTLASEHGPRFTEEQVQALAAEFEVTDGPDDSGEMFQRPGRPSDYIPSIFANEQAARASNGGAYPPDLSLIAKARAVTRGFPTFLFDLFTQYQEMGPDYIHALLTGYRDPPAGVELPAGQYYNPFFISGASLAMPPPLFDGRVEYAQNRDETEVNNVPETVDQYSRDVAAFLMWAAEPHLVDRKAMGLTVMVFLILLAGLVYYTKKKVWAEVH